MLHIIFIYANFRGKKSIKAADQAVVSDMLGENML